MNSPRSSRLGRRTFTVALVLSGLASALHAQAPAKRTIRGTVQDSLNQGRAIAGALVIIPGIGLSTRTDNRGHFEFKDLPPRRLELVAHARRLDSLGLDSLTSSIDLTQKSAERVILSTPGREGYATRMCGASLPGDMGIVRGSLVAPDDPSTQSGLQQYHVAASWLETRVRADEIERRTIETSTSANLGSDFILCGVPTDAEVVLRIASTHTRDTVRVFARISQFVLRRDIHVVSPTSRKTTLLTGRVLTSQGQPLARASINDAVTGEPLGRAAEDGAFAVRLPAHSQQLMLRGLGHQPYVMDFEPLEPSRTIGTIQLEPVPTQLSSLLVEGRRVSKEELQFEARRRLGAGYFIDEATLNKSARVTAAFVASQALIARTEAGPRGQRQLMMWRGSGPCRPRFFVDGIDNGKIDGDDEDALLQRAKRIEMYRAAFAPPEFNDFDGCGAVVIWTR